MLRASRLVASRRPSSSLRLLACACRSASTATHAATSASESSSSSLPPPEPLRRKRSPLYTVPILPPLPPPLPFDVAGPIDAFSPVPVAGHHVSAAYEQLAVLNACLSSGDITRAEEVAKRIRSNWQTSRGKLENDTLSDLLPPRVHADFIKAYIFSSLAAREPLSKSQATLSSHSEGPITGARARSMNKAWSYFDSLFGEQWESTIDYKRVNTAVDASVLAVMMKGITAGGPGMFAPSSLTDPDNWLRPITHLLPYLDKSGISLLDVMRDSVFDIELPSYLGKVDREAVLDALEQTGRGRRGWDDWSERVAGVRDIVIRERKQKEGVQTQTAKVAAPELDPTTSKLEINVSLQTLRTNLSTLALPGTLLTSWERQRLLEESSYDAARQLYMHEMEQLAKVGKDKEVGMQGNWLQSIMFDWMRLLETRFTEEAALSGKASPWGKEADIEPFLRLLAPDKLALITIVELLRLCGGGGVSDGMKAARAILHIGKAVEHEYHAQVLKEGLPNKEFDRQLEKIAEGNSLGVDGKIMPSNAERSLDIMWRREMAKREKEGDASWRPAWSQGIRAKVGSILITALMDVAKIERTVRHPVTSELVTESQPAFSHAYQYIRGTKLGVIKVNAAVAERMDQDPLRITLHPRFLPMVVAPKAWLAWDSGSYMVHSTQVMRTKDSDEQVLYLKQSSDAGALDNIFSGLDVLGGLSWKINRKVFDVVSAVWNTGESLADIPAKADSSMTEPLNVEKPENVDTDPRAKDTYRHRLRKALQDRRGAHSNRCDVNYKLEIGRAFLDETFYFPHNLDFRGRAYPIPPNLSHIGNDMCRGILRFAEAKPLGERGLRWLKIHLANMTGFDKASFDEREAYTMERLEEIYDSADKPLEGNRWWLKAEDPWQCLATCIEIANALRSPVPTEYACALPIHQDGTCNGLQHYAALGGDLKGAHQVNLDIGDRPSDVYSGVAAMANEVIDKEAALGNVQALLLQGKVNRKVVKQTVMTTVYGVTFIGAKKQIEKQLKERGDIPAEHLYSTSLFLGRIVLESIGDVFKGATAIQTWLNRSARLISKSIPPGRIGSAMQAQPDSLSKKLKIRGPATVSRIPKEQMTSVIWTTPLGLPVVQPYRKPKKKQVATALQTVFIIDPSIPAEVDARAQATAFPPNFIHSLDATHMMMTALACKDKIAFASVHDSYWTHACSVDEMSVLLRDTFIELHSQDILGKLRQEFIQRYKGHVVPVSKVPAGIAFATTYDSEDLAQLQASSAAASSLPDPEDFYNSIETEDGDPLVPLFGKAAARAPKVRRIADPERYDDDESSEDALAKSGASKFSTKFSRDLKSKLVLLEDILPPVPSKGDFDLERIRNSLYFFS